MGGITHWYQDILNMAPPQAPPPGIQAGASRRGVAGRGSGDYLLPALPIPAGVIVRITGFLALIFATCAAAQSLDDWRWQARVVELAPKVPVRILWTWGGSALGGNPVHGELTAVKPAPVTMGGPGKGATSKPDAMDGLTLEDVEQPKDRVIVPGDTFDYHYLMPGIWSPPATLQSLRSTPRQLFVTLYPQALPQANEAPVIGHLTLEFEFSFKGKVVKRFQEASSDGNRVAIFIPFGLLGKNYTPTAEFVAALNSLEGFCRARAERLEALPWAKDPLPTQYAIVSNLGGYCSDTVFGCRTSNPMAPRLEARALRQLGVNSIQHTNLFMPEGALPEAPEGAWFRHTRGFHTMGYPVPYVVHDRADALGNMAVPEGAGCAYHPSLATLDQRVADHMVSFMAQARASQASEAWADTVDEIGSVFNLSPEGKAHMGACPYCRAGFQAFLRTNGLGPADFGTDNWDLLRPTEGYWDKPYAEAQAERNAAHQAEQERLLVAGHSNVPAQEDPATPAAKTQALPAREPTVDLRDEDLATTGDEANESTVSQGKPIPLPEAGRALLYYWTRRFLCQASAQMFTPLRQAYVAENAKKRQALALGERDTPAATQPWVYCYAMRSNSFLMGGSSLDFFDFYRFADNAFVYETSNRDARIWSWDSYLCDVGRSLRLNLGLEGFGVLVKPHRGAGTQRALSALSRGATMLYWYTYGPEWYKGDSFAGNPEIVTAFSKFSRLIGAIEARSYGAEWPLAPEIAVVRPVTSEYHGNSASWENGKWIYTALTHAHLPVTALDEGLLLSQDLKRYKAIYLSGSHVQRAVAQRLAAWVAAGGVLYTSGGGLRADEANQPLRDLMSVLGLSHRDPMTLWVEVKRYGATSLASFKTTSEPPPGASMVGSGPVAGDYPVRVGREILHPAQTTQVLASYADGGAALTRHTHGQGAVWVAGTYAGLEYSSDLLGDKFDLSQDFVPAKRTAIVAAALAAGVRPVVDTGHPLVEGVLLRQPKDGKLCVTLMNWAYRQSRETGRQPIAFTNLAVRIRGAPGITRVRLAGSGAELASTYDGDWLCLTLAEMPEVEALLLD
jgi:hypothetical protein